MSGGGAELVPELVTTLVSDVFSVIGQYLTNESFEKSLQAFNSSDELFQLINSIPRVTEYEKGPRIRITSNEEMVLFRTC